MTKTTLITLLQDRNTSGHPGENLYVVRDDQTVFYVGKSEHGGAFRILEHWDGGIRSNERLQEFMECALRDGLNLNLEFLSIADCQALTRCLDDLDEAEGALITLHCPAFNTAGNGKVSSQPSKRYKTYWATVNKRAEDRAAMIRDMPIK